MKLLRYESGGGAALGVLNGDKIVSLEPLDYSCMLQLMESGAEGLARIKDLTTASRSEVRLPDVRLLAPIERPGKCLATGMNYRKHAEEAKQLGAAGYFIANDPRSACRRGPSTAHVLLWFKRSQ